MLREAVAREIANLTPRQGKEALALAAYAEARRCSLAFNAQGFAYWCAVGDEARDAAAALWRQETDNARAAHRPANGRTAMTTQHTPYDKRIADPYLLAYTKRKLRMQREGYLLAKAEDADLLAALNKLVIWCEAIQDEDSRAPADEMEEARAAIAKAQPSPKLAP